MRIKKHTPHPESGNVLWLILLTIALLAVLTVTVSSLSDSTEQSGNIERYRIQASAIMRHASGIREAVNQMRLAGIGESQMSFEVKYLSSSLYTNPNCTTSGCLVYSSMGGGASYQTPGSDWFDTSHSADDHYGEWEYTGSNSITDVGTSRPELLVYIGYLQADLCAQINAMLEIPGGVPVDADGFDTTSYQGSFSAAATIDNMDGYEAGCFLDDTGTRGYTFYQLLVKR